MRAHARVRAAPGGFAAERPTDEVASPFKRRAGDDEVVEEGGHAGTVPAGNCAYAATVSDMPSPRPTAVDIAVGGGSGVVAGLLGVGGGLILVPYLVLLRQWPQKQAQATALVMVAMSSAAGALTYALSGSVAWLVAPVILVGGLLGAVLGSALLHRIHAWALQLAFAVILTATALRIVASTTGGEAIVTNPTVTVGLALGYLAAGLAMGLLSALFGIGGGIILVPMLVTLFGFAPYLAAGTSLTVMVFIALAGAVRQTGPGFTQWHMGAALGLAAMVGAVLGARLALLLPVRVLALLFAVLLVVVAVRLALSGWRARTE